MNIGLIGGRGFVGSGIRKALEPHRHVVTVIERDDYEVHVGKSFDVIVNANGNSKKYLAAASPKEEFQLSVVSVQQSLVDFSCKLYVHCSTVDVYENHEDTSQNTENTVIDISKLSLYGAHKYLAEMLVRKYAKQWIILRFGGFVGEGLKKNSIYDMLNNVPLRVHVDSTYQYFPTQKAGELISLLVEKNIQNELFNVCGDGVISLREIQSLVSGYTLTYAGEEPSPEHYEVNINKLKSIFSVPATKESVMDFVRSYRKQ